MHKCSKSEDLYTRKDMCPSVVYVKENISKCSLMSSMNQHIGYTRARIDALCSSEQKNVNVDVTGINEGWYHFGTSIGGTRLIMKPRRRVVSDGSLMDERKVFPRNNS